MLRRHLTFVIALLPIVATAQSGDTAGRSFLLGELVRAIGAAADAIAKITSGFKSLSSAGNKSYSFVAAQRERRHLIDISRGTAQLIATQHAQVIVSIDQYLSAQGKRTQEEWSAVVDALRALLQSVQTLLGDVSKENAAFVLESADRTLNEILGNRAASLQKLAHLPASETAEELDLLKQVGEQYKALIVNAKVAVIQMNDYVRRLR